MAVTVTEDRLPVQGGQSRLYLRAWAPDDPWAVLIIAHGMAEHIARYDAFAGFLADQGVAVYGCDHAGHGKSALPEKYGYFYPKDGWHRVVDDLEDVRAYACARHPGLPVALLGHSMGSMLARSYITRYGQRLAGVVLSGTAGPNPTLPLGRALAGLQALLLPRYKPSKLLHTLAFSANNRPFAPARTPADWLSSDPVQVDAYIADTACGYMFTATGYRDLLAGMAETNRRDWAAGVPQALPVLIFSGAMDPVGGMGRGVAWVEHALRRAGVRDVTCRLYPQGRHEMLNELGREQVYEDVLAWLKRTLALRAQA
ncbi:MAG: lysophospholipase [Oscillospiraceae bacterium]|jgi:alpha-beta hydrolase superfamily lysophospholipase|nr:lysophospholipase [Oscillospiraceae bacterium]